MQFWRYILKNSINNFLDLTNHTDFVEAIKIHKIDKKSYKKGAKPRKYFFQKIEK